MKNLFISLFTVGLLFLFGMITSDQSQAAEKVIKWRMATLYPRGVGYGLVYSSFADNVKKMSNGRMEIDVIYDGEGVAATEVLGATRTGLIEMGAPYQALHSGELPAGIVELGLPGITLDYVALRALFHKGGWIEALEKAYSKLNIHYIAEWSGPGTYLLTKKPINTLDDLKKLKLRAPGPYGKMLKELGAVPLSMAFGEVYTSLASGVIDGVDGCNILDHRDGKFYEVAKYMYPLPLTGAQTVPIIANMNAWEKLPDDLKAIVTISANWAGDEWAMSSLLWEKEALATMMKAGLKMSPEPSATDIAKWEEAGKKVSAEYEKTDADSKNLIEIKSQFIKKLGL